MQDDRVQYWFNTHTGQVETGKQSLALYRLGPFDSREQAEKAPEIIAQRAAAWRLEDEQSEKT